jgi:hypothetical protein
MSKREENKEVAYLKDETQRHLIEFKRDHPVMPSKSRIIETALEFYFAMAAKYGLDDRWWPKVEEIYRLSQAAEEKPERYAARGRPKHKTEGSS